MPAGLTERQQLAWIMKHTAAEADSGEEFDSGSEEETGEEEERAAALRKEEQKHKEQERRKKQLAEARERKAQLERERKAEEERKKREAAASAPPRTPKKARTRTGHTGSSPASKDNISDADYEAAIRRKDLKPRAIWRPKDMPQWTSDRRKKWLGIATNPNRYYHKYTPPGVEPLTGPWTDEERARFLTLLEDHPSDRMWGLFSMFLPGRTGEQCEKFHASLKAQGVLKGKAHKQLGMRSPKSGPAAGAALPDDDNEAALMQDERPESPSSREASVSPPPVRRALSPIEDGSASTEIDSSRSNSRSNSAGKRRRVGKENHAPGLAKKSENDTPSRQRKRPRSRQSEDGGAEKAHAAGADMFSTPSTVRHVGRVAPSPPARPVEARSKRTSGQADKLSQKMFQDKQQEEQHVVGSEMDMEELDDLLAEEVPLEPNPRLEADVRALNRQYERDEQDRLRNIPRPSEVLSSFRHSGIVHCPVDMRDGPVELLLPRDRSYERRARLVEASHQLQSDRLRASDKLLGTYADTGSAFAKSCAALRQSDWASRVTVNTKSADARALQARMETRQLQLDLNFQRQARLDALTALRSAGVRL